MIAAAGDPILLRVSDEDASGPAGPPPPGFLRVGGASQLPVRRSGRRRAAYRALAVANRLLPKSPRKAVLHSTIDLEDGVLALVDELAARGVRPVVLMEDRGRAPLLRRAAGGRATAVPKRSPLGVAHFLSARYVFTTENVFGNLAPPPAQVVTNIWHGEPPTKVVGRFHPGQDGLRCSYAPVCSTLGRAYRAAEFDLSPLRVPIVGAPRNDRMLRADGPAVRRALLGGLADGPALLWLPSFRTGHWGDRARTDVAPGEVHPGVPYAAADVRRLDAWLARQGVTVVVKPHPHDVDRFTGDFAALHIVTPHDLERRGLTLYPMLSAFDGLVTDMSSVWVDYLLLDRPMVFAFPDIARYRAGRGLNLEPFEHWVPGPFVRTMDDLIAAIDDLVAGRDPMREERRAARRRLHQHLDDGSTARLLDGLGVRPGRPGPSAAASGPTFGQLVEAAAPPRVRPPTVKRLGYRALDVLNRVMPKRASTVVLHSSVDIEDGVLAVASELAGRGWRPTVLLEDPSRAGRLRTLSGGRLAGVPKRSAGGLWRFVTAGQVMTTSNVYGNRVPPPSQVVTSLWHGEPPTKTTARFEGHSGLRSSCAPVCSTVGRAYRAAEFDLSPLRVPIVGAPRNDRMLAADGPAVRRQLLGTDADRPSLLWLPSYRVGRYGVTRRADSRSSAPFDEPALGRLDDWLLAHGARLVTKVHHRDADRPRGGYRAIRVLAHGDLERQGLTLYQSLAAFDGLVTDMSSVWVDYLLLDRPIVFAFPDIEDYRRGRGLNLEPYEAWVPGPFARTMDELLAALGDLLSGRDVMAAERRRARDRLHHFQDGHSSARLLDGLGLHAR